MRVRLQSLFFLAVVVSGLSGPLSPNANAANLPAGFIEQPVAGGWNQAVGLTFLPTGRMFVWERGGRVYTVENDVKSPSPLIDIAAEIGGWRDYGLLGFALHPNFINNGEIFLLYVVDRHHLLNCTEQPTGPPSCNGSYDPNTDEYFAATIGRITRYTAIKPANDPDFRNATTVDYNSRKVLVGETISTGMPILHQSHGVGALLFGTDGTLLATMGDAASYASLDTGSATETYWQDGINDGIIQQKELVGSWRSQLLDSHNGKLLRIDPVTGDGIASNPFYDVGAPRSPRSRVWSLGLRNPFRMAQKPNTGSHIAADGDPGTFYIGDVGWTKWEDLQVANAPGQNFGWPYFEGLNPHWGGSASDSYPNQNTANLDAPNPLYDGASCTREFFRFNELIVQDVCPTCTPSWPNPCDAGQEIPASVGTFVHNRPQLEWRHGQDLARSPYFDSGNQAQALTVGDPLPPGATGVAITGAPFRGNSSTGGVWYTATDFPAQYQNTYFQADFGGQWIKNLVVDANDNVTEVRDFLSGGNGIVALATNPADGALYFINWTVAVNRIIYAPGGNRAPDVVASIDTVGGAPWNETQAYGSGPLAVAFRGDQSSDPDLDPLTYLWDFGDGNTSTDANPTHTFDPAGSITTPTTYFVTLTVTDDGGADDQTTLIVSIANTPPTVAITSPPDGTLYPMTGDTPYDLLGTYSDGESPVGSLTCTWQVTLHHNDHTHQDPPQNSCISSTVIAPVGCDGETYFYRVAFTVTDPFGLATTRVSTLSPDCPSSPLIADAGPDQTVVDADQNGSENVQLDGSGSYDLDNAITAYNWLENSVSIATGVSPTVTLALGTHDIELRVFNDNGEVAIDTVEIQVLGPGNLAPTASFTAQPPSGFAPLPVAFDATGSNDSDGSIVSYAWDFGDGATANGQTVNHTYTSAGSYTATLTVTDDLGATDSATRTISTINAWWDYDWSLRRDITIDNAALGAPLTDVPVLIKLDSSRIDYASTSAGGADLRFIDGDGVTVLAHEIVSWNPGGESEVWVRVPQISAAPAAEYISLYYANPTAADGQAVTSVWSNGYAGVWHLSGDTADSTANTNNGTAIGATGATGLIGAAYQFDGLDDYIDAGNHASLGVTGQLTISAWAQLDGDATGAPRIVSKKINWADNAGYNLEHKPAASRLSTLGSGSNAGIAQPVVLGTSWHHLVATHDNGTVHLYVDGTEVTTDSSASTLAANGTPLSIGRRSGNGAYFKGRIDEVRIASTARSGPWVGYQHLINTDAVLSYGSEIASGNLPPSVSLVAPTDGEFFVVPAGISLQANASDPDGSIALVEYFANGVPIASVPDSPYTASWNSATPGNYAITARATDDQGLTRTSLAANVEVLAAPSVVIDSPIEGETVSGSDVTFTYTITGDPRTYNHAHFTLDSPPHVTVHNLTGSYTETGLTPGPHNMLVQLVDGSHVPLSNPEADFSVNFTVPSPTPPTIDTQPASQTLPAGSTATFSVAVSGSTPLVYQWRRDGADIANANAASYTTPPLTLADSGAQFSVHVSNIAGNVTSSAATLTVTPPPNQPPTAAISGMPLSGPAPLAVDFDGSGSFDTDGIIIAYDWDFGDGQADTGANVTHTYSAEGAYTAMLTVTDDDGRTGTATVTVSVNSGWWDFNWTRQRTLTIDNSASTEDLLDFPLLVLLDATRIDYAQTQNNGEDLRFVDADGSTVLAHEIVSWDELGTSQVFVKVPQIDAGSTSDSIFMYYGNPTAPAGDNPSDVWDNGYAGVWHLDGAPDDSTVNANHGTTFGAVPATGAIGAALSFDGINDYVDAGNDASLGITGAVTLSAWAWVDPGANGSPRIVSKKISWTDNAGYNLEYKPSNGNLNMLGSGSNVGVAGGQSLGGAWHHLVGVNDNGVARLYVDGAEVTTDASVSPLAANGTALSIGRRSGNAAYFLGLIDEVRVSNTARSAAWIGAQHASTTDNSLTYGAELANNNFPPTVTLTAPQPGAQYTAPADIVMEATASDADGSVDRVDFYADGAFVGVDFTAPYSIVWSGVGQGSYVLRARATDDNGVGANSATVSVSVAAPPSPPAITTQPANQTVMEGSTATFSVVATGSAPLAYQWRLNGGDIPGATAATYTTGVLTLAHDGGQYNVNVSNGLGSVDSLAATLTVQPVPNNPPTAAFSASVTGGPPPLAVDFDANASFDGDGSIVSYAWDFGDTNSGSGVLAQHTFMSAGAYTVTLTVTDDDGDTDTATTTISVASDWWDPTWTRRSTLTFANAAATQALSGFPVLVRLDPSRIDYAQTLAGGADLRFIDADNSTVLDHEIASWNPGGESLVWVRVPTIDAGSSSDFIRMYYGNVGASDGQNASGVWGGSYAGVWHLDGDAMDASANANHGVVFGATGATGIIGGAYTFDGGSDYIDAGNDASLGITGAITISAWTWVDPAAGGAPRIVSKKIAWTDAAGYNLEYKPSTGKLSMLGSGSDAGIANGQSLTGAWHHVAGVNDAGTARLYVDGVEVTTDASVSALAANGTSLSIGRRSGNAAFFTGLLDEVRISPTARSADWIAAQYASMSDTFISYSP